MSNYIKVQFKPNRNGIGGSFPVKISLKLDNLPYELKNIDAKIDTGCSISVIHLAKIQNNTSSLIQLKDNDLRNNVSYLESYGVETGGTKHSALITHNDKLNCPALKFRHRANNFSIAGMNLGDIDIHVNYNRKGNILIGMDIIKKWDIHIGEDKDGNLVMLACPRDKITKEYYNEVNKLFDLGDKLLDASISQSENI